MHYSKPRILMALLVMMGLAVPTAALAEDLGDGGGSYFKGPMATCLSRAKVVYPCVSLSPPGYQFNSAFVTNIPLVDNLPLEADKRQSGWLARLTDGEFWNISNLLPDDLNGMNISSNPSGTGMNMNLGPMRFNMYVDEDNFSESRFMLGIDRSW